jgi:hypothetical protein
MCWCFSLYISIFLKLLLLYVLEHLYRNFCKVLLVCVGRGMCVHLYLCVCVLRVKPKAFEHARQVFYC